MTTNKSNLSKIPIVLICILLVFSLVLLGKYNSIKDEYNSYAANSKDIEANKTLLTSEIEKLKVESIKSAATYFEDSNDFRLELSDANQSISDYQVALKDAKNELIPYHNLKASLNLNENEELNYNVSGIISGTKIVPVVKKTADFNQDYIFNFRMIEERANSIIYTYDSDAIHIGELDKKDLNVINEIIIPTINQKEYTLSPNVKIVDAGIAVLLSRTINVYDYNFELSKTIDLPSSMLEHFSSTRTKALDGRESINLYDISSDLKQLTFSDENGVYIYNRISKIKTKIMSIEENEYINEAGEPSIYKIIPLHPKFYHGFIIAEIHSYMGYYMFYIYDLDLKTIKVKEIDGGVYGYHKALGPNFTIASSNKYLESEFPNDKEYHKQTLVYNILTDSLLIHPISQSWSNGYSHRGFDGLNGSLSLVSLNDIKGYIGDMEIEELIAYYYDYKLENYIDKSLIINIRDKSTNNILDCNIIGLLEDNTAIYFIRDTYDDYIFRF